MKRFGPLLTVLAVIVVGVVLFAANSMGNPANKPTADVGAAATSAGASSAAAATPAAAETTAAAPAVKQKAYAGRTSGREMSIAIAVKDGRAVAYACDGKAIEGWFEGTLSGNTLTLRNGNADTIEGTADEGGSTGTIKIGSRSYRFTANAVTSPAGLYLGRGVVKGVAAKVGWIVLGDGSQTGILKPANGDPQPAPALDPTSTDDVRVDGAPVTVSTIDGGSAVLG